ncbi:histidine phosphatase family protein [Streptomyces sp. NPDC001739]
MTLLIIRHAESVENADKYLGFYQDPRPYNGAAAHHISRSLVGLTPRGFRQAQWLAEILPDLIHHQPRVYTSTYRRAIDTAAIALPKLPDGWPQQTRLLDEQHYGDATYMTKRELYDTYPELAEDRRQRKHIWTAPGGGESLATGVTQRAADFTALARTALRTPCVVIAFTHHTAAVALRALLEDLPLPEILAEERKGKLPNAAILQYALHGDRFTRTAMTTPPPL